MTHHHHRAGDLHPTPTVAPSLLRLAVPQRLGLAGVLIASIWIAVLWALH